MAGHPKTSRRSLSTEANADEATPHLVSTVYPRACTELGNLGMVALSHNDLTHYGPSHFTALLIRLQGPPSRGAR